MTGSHHLMGCGFVIISFPPPERLTSSIVLSIADTATIEFQLRFTKAA